MSEVPLMCDVLVMCDVLLLHDVLIITAPHAAASAATETF